MEGGDIHLLDTWCSHIRDNEEGRSQHAQQMRGLLFHPRSAWVPWEASCDDALSALNALLLNWLVFSELHFQRRYFPCRTHEHPRFRSSAHFVGASLSTHKASERSEMRGCFLFCTPGRRANLPGKHRAARSPGCVKPLPCLQSCIFGSCMVPRESFCIGKKSLTNRMQLRVTEFIPG